MYDKIPDELKTLKSWVCWNGVPDESRPGKIKKIPINPLTGGQAQSNNPDTWTDFATACAASSKFSGIGFIFSKNGYFGVDLDGVDEDLESFRQGKSKGIVSEFIDTLRSYAELSQSGRGIHIICKGTLPPSGRRRKNVEMYENGRFFIMTGNACAEYASIRDCTEEIKLLHEKYIGGGREPQNQTVCPVAVSDATTEEILAAARGSRQGQLFSDLMNGNYEPYYKSQSEADLALCNMLSFWFARDAGKIDAAFRSSGLMRPKWERKQSGTTYGALTVAKAISGTREVYSPGRNGESGYTLKIGSAAGVEPKYYSWDDMGNAQRVIDMFGDKIRYSYVNKVWLYYDERRWCEDETGAIYRIADASVESMKDENELYQKDGDEDMVEKFTKFTKSSRSNKGKENMIKELRHLVPIMPGQLDRAKTLINAPNGIIDLKTGELQPHNSELFITKMMSVEYTDKADCPQWQNFLSDIFGGDVELIRYVQKAVGYSMTGSVSEQCAFFLYGTGRNGKSTFLEVIRDILGSYCTNIQPETIMMRANTGGAANSDIARLKGARFVTSVEPNEGVRINEGLLKQLTGDDVVTARKLYGNEFEFKPEFKIWMATNHKPIIRGTDTGIWRRIHLIPFTVQIPEDKIDRRLPYKLKAEMPAILKWCVDGCLLWQREGLRQPRAVMEAVREYRREMDVVSSFIESACITGDGESCPANQLFKVYCEWCNLNNEYCMSGTKFGSEMSKRFNKIKTMNGANYRGIGIDRQNRYSISIGNY